MPPYVYGWLAKSWEKCTAKVMFALVALAVSVIECLLSSMLEGSMKQHHTFRTECTAMMR